MFGSFSDGTQTPESDIDLLIDKGELKGLFMFNSFVNTLKPQALLEVPRDKQMHTLKAVYDMQKLTNFLDDVKVLTNLIESQEEKTQ